MMTVGRNEGRRDSSDGTIERSSMARIIPAPLEFSLTPNQKEQLYKSGYDTAHAFFAGHPSGVNTYGAIPPPQAPTAGG